ncbi:MAG: Amino acid transporter [Fibrobacteres bacterium]|nr:Amino acid transporter [Fibrobacterota bacterium]
MSPGKLFVEFLFGMVGMGYFMAGKRRGDGRLLGCGLALGVFPYFVDNFWLILLLGGALTAIPFIFRD